MAWVLRYLREYQALGTAGGLYHFRDEIMSSSPTYLFVMHSDICSGLSLLDMFQSHLKIADTPPLCTLLTTRVPQETTPRYGCVVTSPTNEVLHYVEKPEFFISDQINGGIYLFHHTIFSELEKIRQDKTQVAAAFAAARVDSMDSIEVPSMHELDPTKLRLEQDLLKNLAGTKKLWAFETHEFWIQMKSATYVCMLSLVWCLEFFFSGTLTRAVALQIIGKSQFLGFTTQQAYPIEKHHSRIQQGTANYWGCVDSSQCSNPSQIQGTDCLRGCIPC
jgi:hypothetical protein